MALGPSCAELQARRVELVEGWSSRVSDLLDLLFQWGALTEEDLSQVRGAAHLGERDSMRMLLDILHARGEEACRAFLNALPTVSSARAALAAEGNPAQNVLGEQLRRHREVLGREYGPADYLQSGGQLSCGFFTEITLCKRNSYTFPLRFQHEAADVGDASREGDGEERQCEFLSLCEDLLRASSAGVTLLQGVAGSGKTTAVRRLVHGWSHEPDLQKLLFPLSFRELNLVTAPQSLHELLCMFYSHLRPILTQLLASDPASILFILDGLDEFCFPLDFSKTPKCSDPERPQSVGQMVVNLIRGSLLPGVSILLTSRPHAVSKIPPQLVSAFYSVLGFSAAQQRRYFLQRCGSTRAGTRVWEYLSTHRPLLLMCHIPAFCWIVVTALQDSVPSLDPEGPGNQEGEAEEALAEGTLLSHVQLKPTTVTEIYCCFLKAILVFHVEDPEGVSSIHRLQEAPRVLRGARSLLKDLGALALRGLLERRFLFSGGDLAAFSVSSGQLSRTFLVEILKEERASLTYERSYHFLHTSLQEFLAAVYYVMQALSGADPFSGLKPSGAVLPSRAFSAISCRLLGRTRQMKKYMKKVFKWSESHQSGHLDLFCRFVSGLMVPRTRRILDGVFPCHPCKLLPTISASPTAPAFLFRLLHAQLQRQGSRPERQVNACHCLWEAQDGMLQQRMQEWLRLLSRPGPNITGRSESEWSELAYLLELQPSLRELNLEAQGLRAEGLRRLLPVLHLFSTLRLAQNPLGPEGATVMAQALKNPQCRVERLWVVETGLGCEGMKTLSEGLQENRTVVDLRMAINRIGDVGARHLAQLLRSNRTLRDIRLRDNLITDEGAEYLKAALLENTTLEYLWLFDNKFTKDGVKKLKEFSKSRTLLDIKVCV